MLTILFGRNKNEQGVFIPEQIPFGAYTCLYVDLERGEGGEGEEKEEGGGFSHLYNVSKKKKSFYGKREGGRGG